MIQALLVFAVLLLFIFLGFPIFMATLMTAIIFVVAMDIPFSLVTIRLFGSINSFSLMAIPFFVLAGNIMGKAQITDKLVNFANAAVGQFKGGLGYVNILTSMLFGGIQGSGAADASAIGGMLIPAMEKQGYDKDYAVAVTAGSSMLSPIIPPSIIMILYSFYTETPVAKLFLGGYLPGILITLLQCGVNYVEYRKRGYDIPITPFSLKSFIRTSFGSIGALITPLIILCGIVFGFVTPTESGVLAIAYSLFYGFFISKKLKLKDFPEILIDSAVTTAVVFMTIAAAGVLANVLVRMQLQNEVLAFAVNTLGNRHLASLFLIIVFLILGCFLDPTIIVAMFGGIVVAVGNAFGFDPIHYGIIMIIIMQIGAITPPVGTFLFIACGVAGLPLEKSVRPLMPYIAVIMFAILIIYLVPGFVTFLPSLMG
ncbi:TRAP transporter large permease [Lacrimispora sp. 210928-DFI.3.58]|uniref:TRAP transporter large permease n=1 Tax=Lacrimispora sp. 210928-DFI.3.58 TaxID=2883214 RepID=UPI0015B605D7|nr:TRAP transporter large permease [Lacrimispora sp. 210928-DFI.3.58]MCB7318184.1 TRAP transporter large permease [Lacrimispora sp. 210928-DFI.3.58]